MNSMFFSFRLLDVLGRNADLSRRVDLMSRITFPSLFMAFLGTSLRLTLTLCHCFRFPPGIRHACFPRLDPQLECKLCTLIKNKSCRGSYKLIIMHWPDNQSQLPSTSEKKRPVFEDGTCSSVGGGARRLPRVPVIDLKFKFQPTTRSFEVGNW